MSFSLFPMQAADDDGLRPETSRRRVVSKAVVAVEPLEGRALLSHLGSLRTPALASEAPPKAVADFAINATKDIQIAQARRGSSRDFLNISTGTGRAAQAARFRQGYPGPMLPALNVTAATARIDGTNLVLTGTVDGPIVSRPTSADQEAIYTFGIDRGGVTDGQQGPFPGREHLNFDSVVVVQVRRAGITGYSQFIMASTAATNPANRSPVTAVSSRNIAIAGNQLTVTVPLSQLPSSGHARNQYRVVFYARTPTLKGFRSVASILPSDDTFRVFFPSPIPIPR